VSIYSMLSNKYGPENAKTGVIAAALFVGVFVAFSGGGDKHAASAIATASSAQPDAFPDPRGNGGAFDMDTAVCVAPQMEVEDRLKSGSGSFEICRILSVSADHKKVVIAGRVTSTNSFNAKIRTAYTAELVKKPDAKPSDTHGDSWLVTSLEFD
jgi:hypothetical protein